MRDNHDQQVFDEFQQEVWDLEEALEATTTKLDQAEARIKRLEEALEPMARLAVFFDDDEDHCWVFGPDNDQITVSDFRRARAALEDK